MSTARDHNSTYDNETEEDKIQRYLLDSNNEVTKFEYADDTLKRFRYLLGLSDLFQYFIESNTSKDPRLRKVLKHVENSHHTSNGSKASRKRKRKTEKEEDAELLRDEENIDVDSEHAVLTDSPVYIQGGTLRDYQIHGLNWLISLYDNRLNGILADEMGLGKTLQTIAFLGFLRHVLGVNGPYIIIAPKSTVDNWRREFERWTPEVSIALLQGSKDERYEMINERLLKADFDVLITSYEMVIREKSVLKKFKWAYLIVDEAHRIKNEESSLSQILRLFYSRNRLLITGTPLQNNLHELWALLNFLLPDVFTDSEILDKWFTSKDAVTEEEKEENQKHVVRQLHQILSPFILRRIKADVESSLLPKVETNVYIGMTDMQIRWYRKLLEKDIDAVNGVVGKREAKTRLLNIVMQLRKCCNHPYLFDGAEPGPPYTTDEHLVYNAGKMIVLDKMLRKFKNEGSRVLIFCQMSRLLDILEDYCYFRLYEYSRIDGSTSHEDRIDAIDEFNKPDLDKFIFLLTTRAGGLGINLTSADVVILYDSDWNPQADLQAMDRAHRIGQTKQVKVFRFVTENAIEEKVLERAAQKLRLDQLVIQQERQSSSSNTLGNSKENLLGMIQHGAQKVFESKESTSMLNDNIDAILQRGAEKTANLNAKFNKLGLDDLKRFTSDTSSYEWDGQNFARKDNSSKLELTWINPSKRERKEPKYSIDSYYKDILNPAANSKTNGQNVKVKPPKQYTIHDHQFFPDTLKALLDREQLAYKKLIGYRFSLEEFGDSDEEFLKDEYKQDSLSRETKRDIEQNKVNSAEPLSEEEIELKDKLLSETFFNWTRRDFTNFIHGCCKFGRDNYDKITKVIGNKSKEEVVAYLEKFWRNYQSIEGYDKYISQIESSEQKVAKLLLQQSLLEAKIRPLKDPLEDLKIQYPPNNSKRVYSKLEDRFILCSVNKHGLLTENLYEKIKRDISLSDLFKFDWFMLSRTSQELGRRVNTLLLAITREIENKNDTFKKLESQTNLEQSPTPDNYSLKKVKREIDGVPFTAHKRKK